MLSRLAISNFALIDELTVNFEPGLNTITGETGAGKSIILGALSLILGVRADTSSLRNNSRKCIVEGTFRMDNPEMAAFFADNDLDFDPVTVVRREISPSGKSRAFINDTPVNLQQLRDLSLRMVDIHSQHQNLELSNHQFQLQVLDSVARTRDLLMEYQQSFDAVKSLTARLESLREKAAKAKSELDYHAFQFNQLSDARLQPGEQEELEEERQVLVHAEEIKTALLQVAGILDGESFPVLSQLREALGRLDKIRPFLKDAGDHYKRLDSIYIDLRDLARETGHLGEITEHDPGRQAFITERLDLIYSLQQKYRADTVDQLIEIRDSLGRMIKEADDHDHDIGVVEKQLEAKTLSMKDAALQLSQQRKSFIPGIGQEVTGLLRELGMPHAVFRVDHRYGESFGRMGGDQVLFMFSANKNVPPDEISRIASGGEISRLMLALKTLVSGASLVPTIIFDEIDAGISGETAMKTGAILKRLSKDLQVINITHLPQIAGMGDHHYKVYKYEDEASAYTSIRKLDEPERVDELAVMVGGANPSETARKTALELLAR